VGHLTVSRVKNEDGAPADYTVGMVEDITERKRAERELRAAHDQLTKELAERTQAEAEIVRLSVSLINAQEESERGSPASYTTTLASKSQSLHHTQQYQTPDSRRPPRSSRTSGACLRQSVGNR